MVARVLRLIRAEVTRVELAVFGVDAGARAGLFVHQRPHDLRVRGADAARQVQRIPLGVASLRRDRVLIEGRQRGAVLGDAAPHALGEDLGRVGEMTEHLDRGPLAETCRAQPCRRHGAHDPRERRRIVGEHERGVLVVPEAFHATTLPNS